MYEYKGYKSKDVNKMATFININNALNAVLNRRATIPTFANAVIMIDPLANLPFKDCRIQTTEDRLGIFLEDDNEAHIVVIYDEFSWDKREEYKEPILTWLANELNLETID